MKLPVFDLAAILSTLAGVSALVDVGSFKESLATVLGAHGAAMVQAVLVLVGLIAPIILRTIGAPTYNAAVTNTPPPPAPPPAKGS